MDREPSNVIFDQYLFVGSLTIVVAIAAICLSTWRREKQSFPVQVSVFESVYSILAHAQSRHDMLTMRCERYEGRPFSLLFPGNPRDTFVYTPQTVEDVLKTHWENFAKGSRQKDILQDLLGSGIFAVDGVKWVHQRKTSSHLFTANVLRETVAEHVRHHTTILERVLRRARDSREPIDVFELMNRLTIECFAKIGFGVDINCLEAEQNHPFQDAFDSVQRAMLNRFLLPGWLWRSMRFLNIGSERQLKADISVVDQTVMDIISQSLTRRKQTSTSGRGADLVSLFLDRQDERGRDEFDPRYLRDIVVNFLIAGRDSTAQAMTWCLYNLSHNPWVVEKIREELVQVVPDYTSGQREAPPTVEEVQHLTFLEATVRETLRLHPSVPIVTRAVVKDTILSDGTLLSAGTTVSIPIYAMGRMEFIWGPDAKAFNPQRWIDDHTGRVKNTSAFTFTAFNAGPRMCLGMHLAMLEMKIVLASILGRFAIELVPGQSVTYDNSITLPIKGEMLAFVKDP